MPQAGLAACGLWDVRSPSRDGTSSPASEGKFLTIGPLGSPLVDHIKLYAEKVMQHGSPTEPCVINVSRSVTGQQDPVHGNLTGRFAFVTC